VTLVNAIGFRECRKILIKVLIVRSFVCLFIRMHTRQSPGLGHHVSLKNVSVNAFEFWLLCQQQRTADTEIQIEMDDPRVTIYVLATLLHSIMPIVGACRRARYKT
jgi:hypothetical protein